MSDRPGKSAGKTVSETVDGIDRLLDRLNAETKALPGRPESASLPPASSPEAVNPEDDLPLPNPDPDHPIFTRRRGAGASRSVFAGSPAGTTAGNPAPHLPAGRSTSAILMEAERWLGRLDEAVRPGLDGDSPDTRRWAAVSQRIDAVAGVRLLGLRCSPERLARIIDTNHAWSGGGGPVDWLIERHGEWQALALWNGLRRAATLPLLPETGDIADLLDAVSIGLAGEDKNSERPGPAPSMQSCLHAAGLISRPGDPGFGGIAQAGRTLREIMAAELFGGESLSFAFSALPLILRRECGLVRSMGAGIIRALSGRTGALETSFADAGLWDAAFADAALKGAKRSLALLRTVQLNGAQAEKAISGRRERTSTALIVDFLFERPVFSARSLGRALDLSDRGAQTLCVRLEDFGLVRRQARAHGLVLWTAPRFVGE